MTQKDIGSNILEDEYNKAIKEHPTDLDQYIYSLVVEFSSRRFPDDSHWNSGNCLWYALILSYRFIMFNPVIYLVETDHFVVKIGNCYYDHTGRVEPTCPLVYSIDDIKEDNNWFNYLIRDCFM